MSLRFTLHDLFLTITLILLRIGGLKEQYPWMNPATARIVLVGTDTLLGAGLLALWRRKRLGALLGLCLGISAALGQLYCASRFYH